MAYPEQMGGDFSDEFQSMNNFLYSREQELIEELFQLNNTRSDLMKSPERAVGEGISLSWLIADAEKELDIIKDFLGEE